MAENEEDNSSTEYIKKIIIEEDTLDFDKHSSRGTSILDYINTSKEINFEGKKYKRSEIERVDFSDREHVFNQGKKLLISTAISEEEAKKILGKILANQKLKPEERKHVYTIEEFYTAQRANFEKRSKDTANFYFEFRYLKAIIKIYNPENRLMLDAGCGPARLAIPLLELGHNLLGIDATPIYIEDAKNKNRSFADKFQIGNLVNLPYENKSFKIIFMMWHVISDLNGSENKKDTIEKAIAEASRCIEDGGIFVFDVPDETSDNIKKHYEGEGEDKDFREFLAKIPKLEYLDELLRINGFIKIRSKHFNWGIHKYVFIYQKVSNNNLLSKNKKESFLLKLKNKFFS